MTPATIAKLVDFTIYSFLGAGFTWTGIKRLRAAKVSAAGQEKKPTGKGGIFLVVVGPIFLCLSISKLVQALS